MHVGHQPHEVILYLAVSFSSQYNADVPLPATSFGSFHRQQILQPNFDASLKEGSQTLVESAQNLLKTNQSRVG